MFSRVFSNDFGVMVAKMNRSRSQVLFTLTAWPEKRREVLGAEVSFTNPVFSLFKSQQISS